MIDRRQLILAGMYGLGALSVPGVASILHARGFTHGVASGEPSIDSILLWTRFVAEQDTRLRVELAADTGFRRIVAGADVATQGERDHTAKITLSGLEPGRWYFYRFIAPDGTVSSVGRTRTLPSDDVSRFGIGLFSCSNLPFGWFNAYAHACERSDLDLIVHVGDYLYEYPVGAYPDAASALPGRLIQPSHELLNQADYRLRYSAYRSDPDLQRLHQSYPVISQWDDHELANDAWVDGAENHQSDSEGEWSVRKAAAMAVYREWMPVSDDLWRSYPIGDLATLFKLETRVSGRSKPLDLEAALKGQENLPRVLKEFRDGALNDAARTLLGPEQRVWLDTQIKDSVARKARWQILSQQVVMGELRLPGEVADWVPADAPEIFRRRAQAGIAASRAGLPFNFDSWGGFPIERERLLASTLSAGANLITLSGDSHNAWAQNLSAEGRAAGVELATHSVTSPGFEFLASGVDPLKVAQAMRGANAGLFYANTHQRGYTSLMLNRDRAVGQFHFLRTISERSTDIVDTQRVQVVHGRRELERG
ncbi:MAG: alkaline phosphatase [Gammaproteobacteria bacterium]|jgi:alkaline phosphatase D|nr:alkaline phosphatase [Gammaproteobacteria bacterium]